MTAPAVSVLVNGDTRTVVQGSTVADLLANMGLTGKRVAVERNGDIVPRSLYGSTALVEADRLEIVGAVGGG